MNNSPDMLKEMTVPSELDAKISTIFLLKSETSAFIMDNTSDRTDGSHASTPMMGFKPAPVISR